LAESKSGSFNTLELHSISKRFGNLQALSNVSLELRPGTVHALLGENGAGLNPLWVIATGIFFGALEAGASALQRDVGIPVTVASVIEALIILAVLAAGTIKSLRALQSSTVINDPAADGT